MPGLEKINMGFIGCGRIADLHYLGYKNDPRARLYSVCDINGALAEKRRREWGAVREHTDFHEMLNDPDLDAVEILTPNPLHEEPAVAAAEAGKHVAVQKPLAVSLDSADRMLAAAAGSGKVFRLTENYVYYPPIVLAKKLIDQGEIGDPLNIRIKFIGGARGGWEVPGRSWKWRYEELQSGRGMQTFDHGHHMWSTAWFFLGSIERVICWVDRLDGKVDCPASVMWQHREGIRYGMCEYVCAPDMYVPSKYYSADEWIEITGTRGIVQVNQCTGNISDRAAVSLYCEGKWRHFSDVDGDWASGFVGATRNFLAAVRGEEQPFLNGQQGREILKIDLTIQESARSGREVNPEELEPV